MKALLLFPQSWTLSTGSPHLALPLLKGFLEAHGVEAVVRDLNWENASSYGVTIRADRARASCDPPTLENMNLPYFLAEDRLMALAGRFNGCWNAQLGFMYNARSHESSKEALAAAETASPFTEYFRTVVVPSILKERPNLIGLTIASVHQIIPSLQLCRQLRAKGYSGFIVLGGNTVSRLAREMAIPAVFDLIDGLIKFQGEVPLLSLCRALESHESLASVPQLIWRDNGVIRFNSETASLETCKLPPPDYNDLPVGRYWGENYLNIVAARGCYYGKCSFCAIPYGWGNNGFSGTRLPELIYQDMLLLMERHGINRFKFVDEALSPVFMRQLARLILANGVQAEWEGYVRLERAWNDCNFVDLVARAGFRKGYFGLEVIPSNNRVHLHKADQPNLQSLLENCNGAGVKVHFFCMFGFPGTGEDEARMTVEFLFNHSNSIDTADIFPWTYSRHTTVAGVEPIFDSQKDWALEFDHVGRAPGVLSSEAVSELAARYEELVWREVPRFLHPTYRLVSPWSQGRESPGAGVAGSSEYERPHSNQVAEWQR
jgi:hypothetical protein